MGEALQAGDWPQFMGPNRNGQAVDEQIVADWPEQGPKVVWSRSVGSGFAGVSVSDGVAVLFHRIEDREMIEAMDAVNGEVRWTKSFPARYVPSYTDDDGPRATPIIHQGRVYTYGAIGNLRSSDLETGKLLWERDTYEDFSSKRYSGGEPPEGYFGLAGTPIIEGDMILANVGSEAQDAGIVAFALDDGRTVWKATRERASYSSPVAVTVDGVRHLIFVTRLSLISLDPSNGQVRFQFPFGRLGPTVNAASPTVFGRYVFVTASYGIGSMLVRIEKDRAKLLWQDSDILASQYTTCIHHDGHLFGIDGRQDGPPADLKCFDPLSRRVLWTEPSFGYATLLKADGKLLVLTTNGELVLLALNPERYEELARTRIADSTTRALPALSAGLLYVRDQRRLQCLDLRP
jgi:outer membrane protein assembly factor BamB